MKTAAIILSVVAVVCGAWSLEQASSQKKIADAFATGRMNGECRFMQTLKSNARGAAPTYIGTPFVKANSLCDSLYPATPQ